MVGRPVRRHVSAYRQASDLSSQEQNRVHANTFAARAGRWSAQHRKTAIWGWIALRRRRLRHRRRRRREEAHRLHRPRRFRPRPTQLALDHFPKDQSENILIQAPKGGSAKDATSARPSTTRRRRRGKPRVAEVKSPFAQGNENQISKDGRSVLVSFKVRGDDDQTSKAIDPVVAAVDRVKAQNSGVYVGEFGGASATRPCRSPSRDDFKKAEKLSLPITLIILVVAFGALVAAGIPLLLGLSAVMATLGLIALPSQIVPMDDMISSIILLIGLAVGVDYTLFYLRREREEKARGAGKLEAVHTAAATSGRAVLVSGFTVMAAMAGMLLAGDRTFTSLGIGAIMVVAVAMIGSLTVVPAMLAWLGDRVDKGRIPFLHRLVSAPTARAASGTRSSTRVLRRPALSAGLAAAAARRARASRRSRCTPCRPAPTTCRASSRS